jgi:ribosome recycling factor
MTKNDSLKSALELAMERLEDDDRQAGIKAAQPLTEQQKQRIAELRRDAEAKLAELEILFGNNVVAATGDPEKTAELEEHHRIDRGRVDASLESAIEKVKQP